MYKLFAYATLSLSLLCVSADAATQHTVRKGETLTEIADQYRVTVQAIKAANGISNANKIKVGQSLAIPDTSAPITYTVQRGDALSDIAKRFGVTIQAIEGANNLRNANRISIGQKLVIPGSQSAASAQPTAAEISTYTVKSGDALSDIAKRYGISVNAIEQANDLANANRISIGQTLVIPASEPTTINYTVRRGDALSDIAKQHGVSLSAIKSANSIHNANRLRVGQVLQIPVPAGYVAPPTVSSPQLDPSDLKALNRIRTKSNQWRHIVIHHSASRVGSAKSFDRFHREERHMENGLAYHFVIGNGHGMGDGELAIGDRWKRQIQGGHLSSYALNQISIGICLVGDFSKTKPTAKQMETLEALVAYLMDDAKVPLSRVTTHTLIHPKHTLCPGKYFPYEELKKKLANH